MSSAACIVCLGGLCRSFDAGQTYDVQIAAQSQSNNHLLELVPGGMEGRKCARLFDLGAA